ncbi:tetraspanin-8-like [Aulostomus maculatus]
MTQINTCLKLSFIIFNIFFAIIGALILALALLAQVLTNVEGGTNLEGRYTSLVVLYIVGTITTVIAILGAYGAHKESRVALVVFLVCMVIGSLLMMRVGIPAAILRPQLEDVLENSFRGILPLDRAPEEVKDMADAVQRQLHCCGLFSYSDWENIPDSCYCDRMEEMEGKCHTVSYMAMMEPQRTSVYIKTCFPIITHYVLLVFDILIAVGFTLAVLALLGMALSSLIIHQMGCSSRPAILLTVPSIFAPPPPKYQELHNPPSY